MVGAESPLRDESGEGWNCFVRPDCPSSALLGGLVRWFRWHEPERVVLVLTEDGEKPLDSFLIADKHHPAVLLQLHIGGIEMPLLRSQPDLVHDRLLSRGEASPLRREGRFY